MKAAVARVLGMGGRGIHGFKPDLKGVKKAHGPQAQNPRDSTASGSICEDSDP